MYIYTKLTGFHFIFISFHGFWDTPSGHGSPGKAPPPEQQRRQRGCGRGEECRTRISGDHAPGAPPAPTRHLLGVYPEARSVAAAVGVREQLSSSRKEN